MAGVWNTLRRLLQRVLRWVLLLMLAALGLGIFLLVLTVGMALLLVAMLGALLRGRRPTPQVWVQRYGQTAWRQGQGWARRGRSAAAGGGANDVVDVQARDVEPEARPRLDDSGP
jgi:hypothetical protein